jgi:DNA-binding Xre family transcriptional regulator
MRDASPGNQVDGFSKYTFCDIKWPNFPLRLLTGFGNQRDDSMLTSTVSDILEHVQSLGARGTEAVPCSNTMIGRNVQAKRTSRGLSRQELSAKLGIHTDDLNSYEAGAKRINANLLLRIAKVLDVQPDYFFRG